MVNFYTCGSCNKIMLMMGEGDDSCGSAELTLLEPNSTGAAPEKHKPVARYEDGKVKIRVGEVMHPAEADHYVEWIYVKTSYGGLYANLTPEDVPEATFTMPADEVEEVYAYCGNHGLWKADEPVLPLDFDLNPVACSPEFALGCVDPSDMA